MEEAELNIRNLSLNRDQQLELINWIKVNKLQEPGSADPVTGKDMEVINLENDVADLIKQKDITERFIETLRKYKRLNHESKELNQEMKAIDLRNKRDQKLESANTQTEVQVTKSAILSTGMSDHSKQNTKESYYKELVPKIAEGIEKQMFVIESEIQLIVFEYLPFSNYFKKNFRKEKPIEYLFDKNDEDLDVAINVILKKLLASKAKDSNRKTHSGQNSPRNNKPNNEPKKRTENPQHLDLSTSSSDSDSNDDAFEKVKNKNLEKQKFEEVNNM